MASNRKRGRPPACGGSGDGAKGMNADIARQLVKQLDAININTSDMFKCLTTLLTQQKEFAQEMKESFNKKSAEDDEVRKKKEAAREEERKKRIETRDEERKKRIEARDEDRRKRLDREEEARNERELKELEEKQKAIENHAQKKSKLLEEREEMIAQILRDREDDRKKRLDARDEHTINLLDARESARRQQEEMLFALEQQERQEKMRYALEREQYETNIINDKFVNRQLINLVELQRELLKNQIIQRREEERQIKSQELENRRKELRERQENSRKEKEEERLRVKQERARIAQEEKLERTRVKKMKDELAERRRAELHNARVTRISRGLGGFGGRSGGRRGGYGFGLIGKIFGPILNIISLGFNWLFTKGMRMAMSPNKILSFVGKIIMFIFSWKRVLIGAFVMGLVSLLTKKAFGGSEGFEAFKEGLSNAIANSFDWIVENLPKFLKWAIPAIGEIIVASFVEFKDLVKEVWKLTFGRYIDKWDAELMQYPVYKHTKEFFGKMYDTFDNYIFKPISELRWDSITEGFKKMIDYIVNVPDRLVDYFKNRFSFGTVPEQALSSAQQTDSVIKERMQRNTTGPTYQNQITPSPMSKLADKIPNDFETPRVDDNKLKKETITDPKAKMLNEMPKVGIPSTPEKKLDSTVPSNVVPLKTSQNIFDRAVSTIKNISIVGEAHASDMPEYKPTPVKSSVINAPQSIAPRPTTINTPKPTVTPFSPSYEKPYIFNQSSPQYNAPNATTNNVVPMPIPPNAKVSTSNTPIKSPDTTQNNVVDFDKRSPKRGIKFDMSDVSKYKNVLDVIAAGESGSEGGYNAMNSGTYKKEMIHSGNSKKIIGKALTDMTIAEIVERGKLKDARNPNRIFAAGRYQIIPSTLLDLIKKTGIDTNQKFSPEVQDYLAVAKMHDKKIVKAIESGDYIGAQNIMASEWAAIPVASRIKNHKGRWIEPGRSFYDDGINKANSSLGPDVQRALRGMPVDLSRFESGRKRGKKGAKSSNPETQVPQSSGEGVKFSNNQVSMKPMTPSPSSPTMSAEGGESNQSSTVELALGTIELFKQMRNLSRQPVVVNNSNNVQAPAQTQVGQQQVSYSSVHDKEFTKLLLNRVA